MRVSLTQRQADTLRFIVDCIRERGFAPSLDEIGVAMDRTSRSTVQRTINCLVERGAIRRRSSSPRGLSIVHDVRGPLVGSNIRHSDFPLKPALESLASIDALTERRVA